MDNNPAPGAAADNPAAGPATDNAAAGSAADDPVAGLAALIDGKGDRQYGLHDLNQRAHALQSALLAEQAGCNAALITAALLHDIGHMIHDLGDNPARAGIDDRHEERGHAYLSRWFGPEVTEPVRLHVAAKRYLCATEPDYFATLSPDSVRSLALQGGPMSDTEAAAFHALPHAEAATRLRRFDEKAKVKDLPTPVVGHFLGHVRACLRPSRTTPADQLPYISSSDNRSPGGSSTTCPSRTITVSIRSPSRR